MVRFHRQLGDAADALVVHGRHTMADELEKRGIALSKIHQIVHGTPDAHTVDREAARVQLGIPSGSPVLLYIGFIHPQKNVHTILLWFRRLLRQVPNCCLYLVGSVQNPILTNRARLKALKWIIRINGLAGSVIFRENYVPVQETSTLYAAADLVLLPSAQRYDSARGVVHDSFAAGRVPLCSRSPKFAVVGTAIDPGLLVSTYSLRAWSDTSRNCLKTRHVSLGVASVCAMSLRKRRGVALRRNIGIYTRESLRIHAVDNQDYVPLG